MKRGFRFSQTLSGTFIKTGAPSHERRLSFSLRAHTPSLLGTLRTGEMVVEGTLDAQGFADRVPIEGQLLLPFASRVIRLTFNFTGNDGDPYRFAGQREIRLSSPIAGNLISLPGGIYAASGRLVASCRTRFDLRRDLMPFLASWGLA